MESSHNRDKQQPGSFLSGGGEMGARIREFDWSKTAIGPIEDWPQSLRTAVSICLSSRFPMVIWWGKDLTLLYNDAWRPILGATEHPIALGSPGEKIWPEIWDVIGPMFESVMTTGQATWADDRLLLVNRFGYTEEAYFTWSYSPIRDESGGVGGVFTAVTETTQRVIGERRLKTLRDLAARSLEARRVEEACRIAGETLAMRVNSQIEIVVSDTGQGIGPEFLPYVFDRFRQADGSTSRAHGGLGLGLAIVRHITELQGGSVSADSPGKGKRATFTVRLPIMVMRTKPSGEERVHPRVSGEVALHFNFSMSLEGVKVLVVDDDSESLLLLSTVLTHCGAYVKTAASAEEGFREVKSWRPNVIVSDIGMPGEDGYSFMRRVRIWTHEVGTWIPAIALTAYARAEDRMKTLSSGYQIHVPKPVEPAELITVITSLIERPMTAWNIGP